MKNIISYIKANKKVQVLLSILVLGAIVVSLGYTYSLFTTHVEREGAFTLIVPELNYTIESSSLNDQKQMTVEAGGKQTFDITVANPSEIESHFKLYYLGSTDENVVVSYIPNEVYPEGLGTLPANGSTTFTITIENNTSSSVTITLGCQGGLKDRELILKQGKELTERLDACGPKPNAPVLVQGQIPVTYSKEKTSWVKADTASEWYDYCNQEWANVVTVKETGTKTREEYMSAEAGTEVSMDDINTMWVWIPRYEYMYTNLGTNYAGGTQAQPGEIKVKFIEGTGITPSDSANYKVHPAFTFGEDEVEGLWYAKFEISTTDIECNSCGTNFSTCVNRCDKLMTSLQVKPNVSSWEYADISNFFNSARNMQLQYASTYGFSQTDSDIHISKNSEWGAVAYLSQSKYGKYGNSDYEGVDKEIYQNKSSSCITGSSNGTPSTKTTNTQVSYDVEKSGTGASTTGNITGIYDMSGGAWEFVMGNYNRTIGSSEFSALPESKYYDLYTSSNPNTYEGSLSQTGCNGGICYGHALSETASWYSDSALFVSAGRPWFVRGGSYSGTTGAGVFYSFNGYGSVDGSSSRLVQVPKF